MTHPEAYEAQGRQYFSSPERVPDDILVLDYRGVLLQNMLEFAIKDRYFEKAIDLVHMGAAVSGQAVRFAITQDQDAEFIQFLIEYGAPVDFTLLTSIISLTVSSKMTREIFDVLISAASSTPSLVLAQALSSHNEKMIDLMLKLGYEADADTLDYLLRIPQFMTPQLLQLLFENGATSSPYSLDFALSYKQSDAVIRALLINYRVLPGPKSVKIAIRHQRSEEMIKLLVAHGAVPSNKALKLARKNEDLYSDDTLKVLGAAHLPKPSKKRAMKEWLKRKTWRGSQSSRSDTSGPSITDSSTNSS